VVAIPIIAFAVGAAYSPMLASLGFRCPAEKFGESVALTD
jgi:hypothetical protein